MPCSCMQVKGAFFLCYSYRITVVLEHQKYSHLLYSADKPQTPHFSNPYVFQRGRYGNKHRLWEVDFALSFLVVHENLPIHFSSTFYFSVFNYRKEVHISCICEPLCAHSFIIKKKARPDSTTVSILLQFCNGHFSFVLSTS